MMMTEKERSNLVSLIMVWLFGSHYYHSLLKIVRYKYKYLLTKAKVL